MPILSSYGIFKSLVVKNLSEKIEAGKKIDQANLPNENPDALQKKLFITRKLLLNLVNQNTEVKIDLPEENQNTNVDITEDDVSKFIKELAVNSLYVNFNFEEIKATNFYALRLNKEEKIKQTIKLLEAFAAIYAQLYLDTSFRRTINLQTKKDQLKLCLTMLEYLSLDDEKAKSYESNSSLLNLKFRKYLLWKSTFEDSAQNQDGSLKNPLNVNNIIAPINISQTSRFALVNHIKNQPLDFSRAALTYINNYRLYWVWCSSLLDGLKTVLELGGTNLYSVIDAIAPIAGLISFGLYFLRLALNLFVILKHVIAPSKEEKELYPSAQQRLNYNLGKKWAIVWNDISWGAANLIWFLNFQNYPVGCFYTMCALLVVDVIATIVRVGESYNTINKQISVLEKSLLGLPQHLGYEKEALEAQLKELTKNKERLLVEGLIDISWSLLIAAGFGLYTYGALNQVFSFILAGEIICFVATVVYFAIRNLLEIQKCNDKIEEYRSELINIPRENIGQFGIAKIHNLDKLITIETELKELYTKKLLYSLVTDITFPALLLTMASLASGTLIIGMAVVFMLIANIVKYNIDKKIKNTKLKIDKGEADSKPADAGETDSKQADVSPEPSQSQHPEISSNSSNEILTENDLQFKNS